MAISDNQLDIGKGDGSLPNSLIALLYFFLFGSCLPILLILFNQFRQVRSLLGRTNEFMFQQFFRRRTLGVSYMAHQGEESLQLLDHVGSTVGRNLGMGGRTSYRQAEEVGSWE